MQNAKINFGVLLPTREAIMSGRADPSALFQIAERAETLGFHSVWVGDSLTARPRIDALTTLAAIGARTQRVRLGTAIFLAALRNPILLAYQLASLDWMTGGRVDLGVGYGRPKEPAAEHEFAILGLDPSARMKMSEELVQVMRRLWRENDVSHAGQFSRFDHVTLEPKPTQAGGVPIWLASNAVEPGLKRVARLADGWINNIKSPELFGECWQKIQEYAAATGRRSESIQCRQFISPSRPAAKTRWSRDNSSWRSIITAPMKRWPMPCFASPAPGMKSSIGSRNMSQPAPAPWSCASQPTTSCALSMPAPTRSSAAAY